MTHSIKVEMRGIPFRISEDTQELLRAGEFVGALWDDAERRSIAEAMRGIPAEAACRIDEEILAVSREIDV